MNKEQAELVSVAIRTFFKEGHLKSRPMVVVTALNDGRRPQIKVNQMLAQVWVGSSNDVDYEVAVAYFDALSQSGYTMPGASGWEFLPNDNMVMARLDDGYFYMVPQDHKSNDYATLQFFSDHLGAS